MKRDPSRKLDPERMLALAKTRKRQDRRVVSYLIAGAIMVLCLGGISWFLWPEDPPRFNLAAYDAVAVPDESIKLFASIRAEGNDRSAAIKGLAMRFQVTATQKDETQFTDSAGSAAIEWRAPKDKNAVVEFMVRHQSAENPRHAIRNQGRVFIWPADSNLLVVDVDHALTEGIEGLAGNTAPKLRSGAVESLRRLSQKYNIAYLCTGTTDPGTYKKLRSWLQLQTPSGPLIGNPAASDMFIGVQIRQFSNQFTRPGVVVVGRSEEAQLAIDAGWKAIIIGGGPPVGSAAIAVQSWTELVKEL